MKPTIRVAILGYGNIGRAAEQAVLTSQDMELTGIYHHNDDLTAVKADVVILSTPTREVEKFAQYFAQKGICTVDSFDIHSEIVGLRQRLTTHCQTHHAVSIIAAGWDPGSDSVIRAIMLAMTPAGITYTNFGPGRSMGHSVVAKAVDGVRDALSMTIPLGTGVHRRMVYIELEEGANFEQVQQHILTDPYFIHDETHVIAIPSVAALNNVAHGVHLERNGVSGTTHNQRLAFSMTINNPALTGQIMVSCARAAYRLQNEQRYGAYTMIELPPIALLEGETEELIHTLV